MSGSWSEPPADQPAPADQPVPADQPAPEAPVAPLPSQPPAAPLSSQAPSPPAWTGPAAPDHEPVLVTVGDIACTEHWVVTPGGSFPISGSTWIVTNQTTTSERIPPYAIVLAIVFFLFCLLGLFFLLIKQRTMQGWVTVTVQAPGGYHATQVPVSHPSQIADVENRVHYIRGLAAAARS